MTCRVYKCSFFFNYQTHLYIYLKEYSISNVLIIIIYLLRMTPDVQSLKSIHLMIYEIKSLMYWRPLHWEMKCFMTFINWSKLWFFCQICKYDNTKNAHFDVMKSCITWWPKGIYTKQAVFSQDFSFLLIQQLTWKLQSLINICLLAQGNVKQIS